MTTTITNNPVALQVILDALLPMADGSPAPSWKSANFKELLAATSLVAQRGKPAAYEAIGRATLTVLLDRLSASMQSERALAIMRLDGAAPQ